MTRRISDRAVLRRLKRAGVDVEALRSEIAATSKRRRTARKADADRVPPPAEDRPK